MVAMTITASLQRGLLFALIACVALCSVAGIYVLIGGNLGWFESRVLGTSVLMAVACLLGWAAALPLARNRWRPAAVAALLAILAAVAVWLVEIWDLLESRAYVGFYQTMEKCLISVSVVAGLTTHIALLGLAKLRTGYEWVRLAAVCVSVLLLLLVLADVWMDIAESEIWRGYGVLIILGVCGSITVMVLHRISGLRTTEGLATVRGMLTLTCPRCSHAQQLPAGKSRCARCGLGFHIEILEDQCRKCGYPLYQLESTVCPECGTPFATEPRPAESLDAPL